MKPGPMQDFRPAGQSFVDKAHAAWQPLPGWVAELARLADREGLKGAAKRINYSVSAVSTVIGGKYAGDMARVEAMVRGALMSEQVECPVLGEIGRDRTRSVVRWPLAGLRSSAMRACSPAASAPSIQL